MNTYHVMIDLKDEARALAFSLTLRKWMEELKAAGKIGGWQLMRRKLNLASDAHRDFILIVEVADLAQLDAAFRYSGSVAAVAGGLREQVHGMIETADFGLYRPFPDDEQVEAVALI